MSWNQVRQWAMVVKRDMCAVYLASRDPRVPWYAKVVAVLVAAYALSPIDLIPDFIPVIGYLDDLLLLPFGIFLVIRLVPQELMAEHRLAATKMETLPKSWWAVVAIIILWMAGLAFMMWLFTQLIGKNINT